MNALVSTIDIPPYFNAKQFSLVLHDLAFRVISQNMPKDAAMRTPTDYPYAYRLSRQNTYWCVLPLAIEAKIPAKQRAAEIEKAVFILFRKSG